MSRVVIFGAGQIAEIAYYYLTNDSDHEVVGFTVDKDYIESELFHSLPVVEYESVVKSYPPSEYKMFIPISYKGVNKYRAEKYLDAKSKGYSFVSYISTKAIYYGTEVGENCFIFEGNIIQPYTKIGNNCILWSGNHIGHHSVIGDNCFISSHVVVSGNVSIGDNTFLGVNSTIADNVSVGKFNVIGANALIMKGTDDKSVFSLKGTEKSKVPSNKLRGF